MAKKWKVYAVKQFSWKKKISNILITIWVQPFCVGLGSNKIEALFIYTKTCFISFISTGYSSMWVWTCKDKHAVWICIDNFICSHLPVNSMSESSLTKVWGEMKLSTVMYHHSLLTLFSPWLHKRFRYVFVENEFIPVK